MKVSYFFFKFCVGATICRIGLSSTPDEAARFVARHNEVRKLHCSGDVVWDETVAAVAQAYVDTCPKAHSGNGYGENLAWGHSSIEAAVQAWYDEKVDYDYDLCYAKAGKTFADIGHFTQVVWKKSTKIGCGIKQCSYPYNGAVTYMCNYSPPGNYGGQYCANVPRENCGACAAYPCKNGATCVPVGDTQYTCTCVAGYEGTNCETDKNECSPTPCQNGATCIDGINKYTCNCVPGYSGTTCATDINECAGVTCENLGICQDKVNAFQCNCAAGYKGTYCATWDMVTKGNIVLTGISKASFGTSAQTAFRNAIATVSGTSQNQVRIESFIDVTIADSTRRLESQALSHAHARRLSASGLEVKFIIVVDTKDDGAAAASKLTAAATDNSLSAGLNSAGGGLSSVSVDSSSFTSESVGDGDDSGLNLAAVVAGIVGGLAFVVAIAFFIKYRSGKATPLVGGAGAQTANKKGAAVPPPKKLDPTKKVPKGSKGYGQMI